MRRFQAVILSGLLASLLGCGKSADSPATEQGAGAGKDEATSPAAPPAVHKDSPSVEPAGPGVVHGIVRMAAGELPPLFSDLTPTGTVVDSPKPCRPFADVDRQPLVLGPQRGLAHVHVAVTGMSAAASRQPKTHEVVIKDCRLWPPMLAALAGDTIRITNQSVTPFMPSTLGSGLVQALLPGKSREEKVDRPGALDLRCHFGGFCGRTYVVATAHTLYAVTDADGRFRIEGVPAGENIVVHAWHPLLEHSAQQLKLSKTTPADELVFEAVGKPVEAAAKAAKPVEAAAKPAKPDPASTP